MKAIHAGSPVVVREILTMKVRYLMLIGAIAGLTTVGAVTQFGFNQQSSQQPGLAQAAPCAANPCANPDTAAASELAIYSESGIAIDGTDPVAYFTVNAPVPGSSEFTYEWGGATWQFSSAENRDLFVSNPEAYAPQYGGHCAWAVAQGYTAPTEPDAWSIVDGKLYLNFNRSIQTRWERDISGNIAKGDSNWPEVSQTI